jgi:hypothetical protein
MSGLLPKTQGGFSIPILRSYVSIVFFMGESIMYYKLYPNLIFGQ